MKELLKKNRGKLLLSSLMILLPMIPAALAGRTALFWYPIFLLAAQWLVVFWVFHDWKNKDQNPKALGMVVWVLPATSLFLQLTAGAVLQGGDAADVLIAAFFFFFGVMFLVLGNYMPKIRQNHTLGIRVKWTLASEENWNATHRFAGKVWVAGGLLCMVCALIPSIVVVLAAFVVLILVMALVPTVYSYRFYRRQLEAGKVEKSPVRPASVVLVLLMILAFGGFLVFTLFSGSLEITCGSESLTVEAGGWGDLTVDYQEIQSVEYFARDPSKDVSGMRTNGMGNFRFSMGTFQNDLYGSYTRYTHASCDACVVLEVDGQTVVLNGPDEASTQALYDAIQEHVSQ